MDDLSYELRAVKTLLSVATDQGLTTPFGMQDVMVIERSTMSDAVKTLRFRDMCRVLHEIMYASPPEL